MQAYNFNEALLISGIFSIHTTNISGNSSFNYLTCYYTKALISAKLKHLY